MRVRCTECKQFVRLVDPGNGCRPWLGDHRYQGRICDGAYTTLAKKVKAVRGGAGARSRG